MNKITREFWFSAAHMIDGHPKCGRLHGHNYKVVISLTGPLDNHGMVMDFGLVDEVIKPIIEELDHYTLFSRSNIIHERGLFELCNLKGWAVSLPIENSTAELLAQYIHAKAWSVLGTRPENISVLVQETRRNEAEFIFEA